MSAGRGVRRQCGTWLSCKDTSVWAIPSGVAAASHPALTVADVVLIDLGMPLMNGFQLADVIKRKPRTDVLLIAVTGWKRPDDDAAARAAGFDHYFTKPVDTDLLDSYIGRFLAEHPRNRASALSAASDVGTQAHRVGEPA